METQQVKATLKANRINSLTASAREDLRQQVKAGALRGVDLRFDGRTGQWSEVPWFTPAELAV